MDIGHTGEFLQIDRHNYILFLGKWYSLLVDKSIHLWRENRSWTWQDVLVPFFATRLALLIIGYFAQMFVTDPVYPYGKGLGGWTHLLDIWNRWDASWYMEIIQRGYSLRGDLADTGSNIAFFPLYPLLLKFFLLFCPDAWEKQRLILLIGVVVSNLCLLAALLFMYRLVNDLSGAEDAKRSVFYLLAAPTSFYFSAFYTEALFLLCLLAAFYFASRSSWIGAGLAGALAALCRPVGVLMIIPLGLVYLHQSGYQLQRLRTNILWLGLIPAALLGYFFWQFPITGDLFAPFKAQAAWGRIFATPWETFLNSASYNPYIDQLQHVTMLMCLGLILPVLIRLPIAYGICATLLVLPGIMSGSLLSFARIATVAFPFYIVLAQVGRKHWMDRIITSLSLGLQGLLMAAWVMYYPIY